METKLSDGPMSSSHEVEPGSVDELRGIEVAPAYEDLSGHAGSVEMAILGEMAFRRVA